MSFLHKQSYECTKTELDLFEVPPTQIYLEAARIVEYFPIASIDNGPIEFFISGSSEEYIDLSQTFYMFNVVLLKAQMLQLLCLQIIFFTQCFPKLIYL